MRVLIEKLMNIFDNYTLRFRAGTNWRMFQHHGLHFLFTNCMSNPKMADIYNLLKSSLSGIVLAAEVAIGSNPLKSIALLSHLIKIHEEYQNDFLNTKILEKPSNELIGDELFNWI